MKDSSRDNVMRLTTALIAVMDYICFMITLILGYAIWSAFPWHGHYQPYDEFARILWILPPLGIIVFEFVGLYKAESGLLGVQEQSLIFKAIWIIYAATFVITFFYREVSFSRLAILYSVFFALFLLSFERYVIRHVMEFLRQHGFAVRRALIYGGGYHGQRLARWIRQSPKLGIEILGFLDDNIEKLVKKPDVPSIIGGIGDLKRIVKARKVSVLFVAHRKMEEKAVLEVFQTCRDIGIQCWIIPMLYHLHMEQAELTNIGGIPLVSFRKEFGFKSYQFFKAIFDLILVLLVLPLVLPLGILIAIGIKLTSRGPVFFRQKRVGRGGKVFTVFKFRTLSTDAPKQSLSPELKKKGLKVNAFASFLRRSGLDELPQILNVLKGEMSFIGPRPEMPFLVDKYGPVERERLIVKPGITGLWQISEERKKNLIHENMDYDLYYVEHLSFNLDLAITIKTFLVVFRRMLGAK